MMANGEGAVFSDSKLSSERLTLICSRGPRCRGPDPQQAHATIQFAQRLCMQPEWKSAYCQR